jgi:hypothetical protein
MKDYAQRDGLLLCWHSLIVQPGTEADRITEAEVIFFC